MQQNRTESIQQSPLKEGLEATGDLAKYTDLGVKLKMAEKGTYDAEDAVKEYNKTRPVLLMVKGNSNDLSFGVGAFRLDIKPEYGDDMLRLDYSPWSASTQVLSGSADAMVKKYKAQRDIDAISGVDNIRSLYTSALEQAKQEEGGLKAMYDFMRLAHLSVGENKYILEWKKNLVDLYKMPGGKEYIKNMRTLAEQQAVINANQVLAQKILEGAGVTELIDEQTTATKGSDCC